MLKNPFAPEEKLRGNFWGPDFIYIKKRTEEWGAHTIKVEKRIHEIRKEAIFFKKALGQCLILLD